MTGRPTILTPELHREIVDLIRAGNYLDTAASLAGTTPDTARRWLRRGGKYLRRKLRAEENGEPFETSEYEEIFSAFFLAIKKARAYAEARNVANINSVAMGQEARVETRVITHPDGRTETVTVRYEGRDPQWTASAWYLERTAFERWGRKERRELTGAGGKDLVGLDAIRQIINSEEEMGEEAQPSPIHSEDPDPGAPPVATEEFE